MDERITHLVLAASICLAPLLTGCSGSDESAPGDGGEVASEAGSYLGVFHFDPDPSVTGDNELHATLSLPDGSALPGATLSVEPWMPSMGHGSPTTPVVHDMGEGEYHIGSVDFTMPGDWEVRIEVSASAGDDRFVLARQVQ